MLVIIGAVLVLFSVVGGFVMEHGPIGVLIQPVEMLIICGSAAGSMMIMVNPSALKVIVKRILGTLGGEKYTKKVYVDLLKMLYELFQVAKKDGLMGIEPHIEKPKESIIFKKYKSFLGNHHAVDFLCDSLRMLVSGGISPYDLESLMDSDLTTHHEELAKPQTIIQTVADSLPGFGIVAAVLGVVLTMQKIGGPPEEIGKMVGAALVGTFLGILFAYGFIGPIATNIGNQNSNEAKYFEVIKACVIGFSKGAAPILAVESGRRVIFSSDRPTFFELEKELRGGKE